LLYAALVYAQTRSHRDDYELSDERATQAHARPSRKETWMSFLGLMLSLGVVIGLAKALSPSIEAGVTALGAPRNVVGVVIALLVLLPETWAAISAARSNQLQTSLNLALGSGAASIALTIPVVSLFSIFTSRSLALGLDDKSVAFLLLTFITGGITLGSGRTTALQGLLHLVLLFAYLAFSFIP
jgi:Ca2+:H+ antiporter